MLRCWIITAFTFLFSCGAFSAPNVQVDTNLGSFTIELEPDKAPITVANFLKYVQDGSYAGSVFHRVIPNFIVQGGGFTPEMVRLRTYPPIINESGNGLSNAIATVAMARPNAANSATRQFFINLANNDFLDKANHPPGYAVFGKVVSGFSIIQAMSQQPTNTQGFMKNVPKDPIIISKVTLLPPMTAATSQPKKTTPSVPSTPESNKSFLPVTARTLGVPLTTPLSTSDTDKKSAAVPVSDSQPQSNAVSNTAKTMDESEATANSDTETTVHMTAPSENSSSPAETSHKKQTDDLSSLLTMSEPAKEPINFEPLVTLSQHNFVSGKTFTLITKDFRKSPYIAYSDDCSFNVKPIDAHQNVQNAIEKALSEQFQYQGFNIRGKSLNTITIEIPKALIYVKNANFENHMYANVVISITAETPRGKLVKTYNGTAKRTAAFKASNEDIEMVLNDISSQVLKKVAEDAELQDYMKERF